MKKGIVALLVVLALVVLVSPGIVGRLAEKSVEDQLQWAASENEEVVVTTQSFDRGWFSSEGVHRVALGRTGPGANLRMAMGFGPDDEGPALIISTKLDHGLIAVTSLGREEGSLAPGLGRAVSTLTLDNGRGETVELPGVVYSAVGLDGGVDSHYFLEPGSKNGASWGAADLKLMADQSSGRIVLNGGFDSLSFVDNGEAMSLGRFDLDSDMTMTQYGFSVGDLKLALASATITSPYSNVDMGPFTISGATTLDGGRMNSDVNMNFEMAGMPGVGDVSWDMDIRLANWDAEALGGLIAAAEQAQNNPNPDPALMFMGMQSELMDLAAAGLEFHIDRFDVSLPQGTVLTRFSATLPAVDRASFSWGSALLGLEASTDVSIPKPLFQMVSMMSPQAQQAVAMGILRDAGDNYVMEARYKQGLLTVNGAPMPIPMPGM